MHQKRISRLIIDEKGDFWEKKRSKGESLQGEKINLIVILLHKRMIFVSKEIHNQEFGMERASYSVVAVLIFLSGIYFGSRYLPAVQENQSHISYNKDPLIKKRG